MRYFCCKKCKIIFETRIDDEREYCNECEKKRSNESESDIQADLLDN
jgi:hypothetical protein